MAVATIEFRAQSFEFSCEVVAPIVLNEHKGSALRGAVFHSLRRVGCSHQELRSCHACPLVKDCAVSYLLATVDEEGRRGGDVPRPFVVRPPLEDKNIFEAGARLKFGINLFAQPANFLPYLLLAVEGLEREGLGAKYEQGRGQWRRGALRVREIAAVNLLSGERQLLFGPGSRYVDAPEIPVTQAQVLTQATTSKPEAIRTLHFTFHSPTRLVAGGKPLIRPDFPTLVQRLIERVSSLSTEYGGAEFSLNFEELMAQARAVLLLEDRTSWERVRGYSTRQHQDLSLGGFVGQASFKGRVDKLLPLLLWGQITHVGKDATKGNGWYSLQVGPATDE